MVKDYRGHEQPIHPHPNFSFGKNENGVFSVGGNKGYMLIAAIENQNNLVVLYENKDLDKVKEVAEIINSFEEFGYYEEMRDAGKVIETIKELAEHSVDLVGDNSPLVSKDDEFLPEIEHFEICKVEVIKNE